MSIYSREFELKHDPESVRTALVQRHLQPYFKQSGWLARGGLGKKIRWTPQADGSLVGKLGYFQAKHLCIFRFVARMEPSGPGTRLTLSACHGPFSPLLIGLSYVLGLCMFVIGVVFSFIGHYAMRSALKYVLGYVERHLSLWDDGASLASAPTVTGTTPPPLPPPLETSRFQPAG